MLCAGGFSLLVNRMVVHSLLVSFRLVLFQVERTFEVTAAGGEGKVFDIGDCTNLPTPKTAYIAGGQGKAIAKQVATSAAGKPLKDIVPMVPVLSVVPVGKSSGVSVLPIRGMVVGDFMTRKMKSADMFVSKYWKELGMGKPPAAL